MKRKDYEIVNDDDMESTLRDLNSEAVMRLDESIGLVVTAMNQIRYASKSELVDCLKNPVDNSFQ